MNYIKCMMLKKGRCNSDYGNKIKCDGLEIPPRCPYEKQSLRRIIKEQIKNDRV